MSTGHDEWAAELMSCVGNRASAVCTAAGAGVGARWRADGRAPATQRTHGSGSGIGGVAGVSRAHVDAMLELQRGGLGAGFETLVTEALAIMQQLAHSKSPTPCNTPGP